MPSSASSGSFASQFLFLMFVNLGHYNLFNGGILHRDISSGNVLRYSEPVIRPALKK
jgi:hypothetical protein